MDALLLITIDYLELRAFTWLKVSVSDDLHHADVTPPLRQQPLAEESNKKTPISNSACLSAKSSSFTTVVDEPQHLWALCSCSSCIFCNTAGAAGGSGAGAEWIYLYLYAFICVSAATHKYTELIL